MRSLRSASCSLDGTGSPHGDPVPSRATFLGLSLAAILACGGGEAPLQHAECAPEIRPASAPQSLSAHVRAAPAWAAEWEADPFRVGGVPVPIPQIPDIPAAFARVPPGGAADGGPILCVVRMAGEGMATAAITLPGEAMARLDDRWPAMPAFAFSLPGAVIPPGAAVPVAAARVSSRCKPDTFLLLTTGVPIPECRDQRAGVIEARPRWSGGIEAQANGSGLSCRAMDYHTAAAAAAGELARFDHTLDRLCRQPAWADMSEQTARGFLRAAAAYTGWADPPIRAAAAQLDRVKAAYVR